MADALPLVISALEKASGTKARPDLFSDLRNGKDVALADLDMDSLSRFEVIMQIEEQLDIELDEDEVQAQTTVFEFAGFVTDRSSKA